MPSDSATPPGGSELISPTRATTADDAAATALLEQDIPYGEAADGNLVGFLAVPADAAEPLPGVLVLHEWWGLTPAIRDVARRIAREGYVVLAVDLYGGRTAASVNEAQLLLRELVDAPDAVRDNIRQAYVYLERYALAPRIGTVGWDLGGRWSLQAALMMPDEIDVAVIFYGAVETDEALLETLDMPVLGLFGEEDPSVPVREVQEFRNVLGRLGKPADVHIYSGAEHGFFFAEDPNYSRLAADDAWVRTRALLASALKE
jgi:carboxymethylenebutenolidase